MEKLQRILASGSLSESHRRQLLEVLELIAQGQTDIVKRLQRKAWETLEISADLRNISLRNFEPARRIPPMDEFMLSRKYMNRRETYPRIMDIMMAADDPTVREVYICAGKGVGKSHICSGLLSRGAFILNSYPAVREIYHTAPGVFILMLNMSISATEAQGVIFQELKSMIKYSACFANAQINTRDIRFPNDVLAVCGHSGYQAFYGFNIFYGCVDEASHFDETPDHDVAQEIAQGIRASQITRFPLDYKFIAISSPRDESDFLVRNLNEIKTRGQAVKIFRGDSDSDMSPLTVH